LDEFFECFTREPRPGITKATVSAWRVVLEDRGLGSISINVRITALRKLAVEAADNGLLAPELAAGITRIKGVKSKGVRVGNWLSIRQAQTLLNTPDVSTKKGLRDRTMLAVLLGCGAPRWLRLSSSTFSSEMAADALLTLSGSTAAYAPFRCRPG
jgi:site-specific recombinase XerD